MKIAKIEPLFAFAGRNLLLVKITTDEGIIGWGESGLSGREKAVIGALEHFSDLLIGVDPRQIGHIWQLLYRSQYFEGGRVLSAAISAIDIALHDIKGKALGVPVFDLLGGKQRDLVPAFASTHVSTCEQLIEDAKTLVDQGWNCIRLSPAGHYNERVYDPRESIAETAKWMIKARDELGESPVLGVDYHHRLNVAEAASFCQKMPSGTLDFLEEPIRDETPEAYRTLRRMTDVPFAIGEEFASKWQALPYIDRGLAQFMRIDICNVGGFTESMKIAGWCEAHYVDLMPHNPLGPICTAASVHLGAAVQNFSWLECRDSPVEHMGFDGQGYFDGQMQLEGAFYRVPDKPGLGVEVDETALRASPPKRGTATPNYIRPDGSVTNW
ncbi:MAG: mandelate racemase/muconate lactonizing enzyme family protein [Roseibium sp.]